MKKIIQHLQQNWIRYGFESVAILVSILAAFALNNWNEDRRNHQLEEYYLERMVTDLNLQQKEMEKVLRGNSRQVFRALYGLGKFGEDTLTFISQMSPARQQKLERMLTEFLDFENEMDKINNRSFGNLVGDSFWSNREVDLIDNAFMEMNSNGHLDLIRHKELRQRIIEFYSRSKEVIDIQDLRDESRIRITAFLESKSIAFTNDYSFPEFQAKINNSDKFMMLMKNYIASTLLAVSPYEGRLREDLIVLRKDIAEYLKNGQKISKSKSTE